MERDASTLEPAEPVAWKSLALPAEHGGWGMLIEPILLGLALAPSWAGAGLALAVGGAFLARHPLKLSVTDRLRGARHSRTHVAQRVALVYCLVAAAGLASSLPLLPGSAWLPLLLALPLAAVQFAYDVRLRGRRLLPELLGSAAPGSVAAALLLGGGWRPATAFGAWLALGLKGVSSVLYVRARLRRDRGQPASRWPALASHAFAGGVLAVSASAGILPWLGVAAFALLLARAVVGLSRWRRPLRPQAVGLREMGWGFLTVCALAIGLALDW